MKTIRPVRESAVLSAVMAFLLAGCVAPQPAPPAGTEPAPRSGSEAAQAVPQTDPSSTAITAPVQASPGRQSFSIENRPWFLINLPMSISVNPPHSRDSYVWFRTPGSRLEGYTGCNPMKADYEMGEGTVKIKGLTAGKMACDTMTFEALLIQTLSEAVGWEILEDGRLLLKNETGFPIAVFRPGDR